MTSENPILWEASQERLRQSHLVQLQHRIHDQYGLTSFDYRGLHEWSVGHTSELWQEVADYCDIRWQQQPTRAWVPPPTGKMRGSRWFENGRMNFAENLLWAPDDQVAIQAWAEGSKSRQLTYAELRRQVAKATHALRALGVGKGDRVAGVVANVPEAVIAMLAAASLGAIWSSCSPDFGVKGILDRFAQIEPKVLFYTRRYCYGGIEYDLQETAAEVTASLPQLQAEIAIDHLDHADQENPWQLWLDRQPENAELSFAPLPFDHPLYIMFSSGTTGIPKCIVHGAGNTLLQHKKELQLHSDLKQEDRICYFTTCGWMMWNWVVSSLSVGATLVLYEGSPAYPSVARMWEFLAEYQVTHFGTSPKFLGATAKAGYTPKKESPLTLKTLLSTGSPLLPEQFDWVYDNVASDLHLSSISGGTDIISCFMLGNLLDPVRRGEIQGAGLGMAIASWDDSGKPVVGQKGELVCTKPFPSMPLRFWNDPEDKLYTKAYFSHYTNGQEVWRHGDYVAIAPTGGITVYGRSDATLNPGGVRIGTAEIYRQVETLCEIQDSICAAKTRDDDCDVVLFVQLAAGHKLDEALQQKIKTHIRGQLTPRHVPRHIVAVTGIPYTRSGKKVEMAVTKAINGDPVANVSAISNPDQLEQYTIWGKSLV